ncbi:pilus assembly protein TadG-related protein [Paenibacillus sp.]|uniref:pilus assembly protein TadG-related protein n=1 Tax=Paenibacillus sp. TaxID=58172 RepID=UPI002D4E8029|nr:pilus assembly protein TadG-related protein [Paenibacillus sp.]HZG84287.1 pilus assembly protein TadG-related protein [Paenibacillus sp.]
MRRFIKRQEGGILVLAALTLSICMLFAAVLLDVGLLYMTKSKLRQIANAAVLSAAQELTHTETDVNAVLNDILTAQQARGLVSKVEMDRNRSLTLRLEQEVSTVFAPLIGFDAMTVSAEAQAVLAPIGRGKGAVPIAMLDSVSFVKDTVYSLQLIPSATNLLTSTLNGVGSFGVLRLLGPGANLYGQDLRTGFSGTVGVNDVLSVQLGNVLSALATDTRNAINDRISRCPHPPGETYHRDCSRVMLIPLYRAHLISEGQLVNVKITGFAYFYLLEPMGLLDTAVKGKFIDRVGTGHFVDGALDRGAYTIRLVE